MAGLLCRRYSQNPTASSGISNLKTEADHEQFNYSIYIRMYFENRGRPDASSLPGSADLPGGRRSVVSAGSRGLSAVWRIDEPAQTEEQRILSEGRLYCHFLKLDISVHLRRPAILFDRRNPFLYGCFVRDSVRFYHHRRKYPERCGSPLPLFPVLAQFHALDRRCARKAPDPPSASWFRK